MKKIELVSPAGDLEKLRCACRYGADAVYLSDKDHGMRRRAGNFSCDEIAEGVRYAHRLDKKVYAAVNIFLRNAHIAGVKKYLSFLREAGVDAIVAADPGVIQIVRDLKLDIPLHLSTLANVTNAASARFWEDLGVKRIILARELSFDEIRGIRREVRCELEVFVHGAMCVSYSGRCLLSSYLTGRNANLGDCAQSCRWRYALVEENRPGRYFPVEEDEAGTYLMSAKDLLMAPHIKDLIDAGVDALKIEGRIKSLYYVGNVTRIYRGAIDAACQGTDDAARSERYLKELSAVPNRGYSTGFFFGKPDDGSQLYDGNANNGGYQFVGTVLRSEGPRVTVRLKNPVSIHDTIECISPDISKDHTETVLEVIGKNGLPVETAAHDEEATLILSGPAAAHEIMRRKIPCRAEASPV
jgi:putative protease